MPNFKPNLLTLALMAGGLSFSGSYANAQEATADASPDADEEAVEVITVTGIRSSLQRAQAVKMENSSIVEAISAVDIGKLPDASIAESIARLPGITAQRLDGRANVISIRGLSPDFTTATLNGREQVTVGDNRGVEFDQYPSELMSGVVVYKTPDAKLQAQAIGGTVDMQTIRPLAHGKQTVSVGLRYEENDLGKLNADGDDKGYRGSISYIDQFADDTVGIAIGYAHMESPNQEERWNAWGYPETGDGDLVLGGAKPYVRSSELERDGILGVLEYRPNDQLHTTLDVYYSEFTDTQILRGIELPLAWSSAQLVDPVIEDGLVTSGTFNDVEAVMRNDINIRDADLTSVGWNTEYFINDSWRVEADLSYSKANRKDFGLESYSGTGRGSDVGAKDNIGFELTKDGGALFNPTLDYSDTDLFQIGAALSWGNGNTVPSDGQDGFINTPEIEDELKAIKLSAEHFTDSGLITSVEFGVNYSEREKSKEDNGYYLTLNGYPDMMTVPDEYLLRSTSLDFIGMGDMLSYDSYKFYKDGNYTETSENLTAIGRSTGTWVVSEDVTVGFVQLNFETEVSDMLLSGNIGTQVVYTDQYSDGIAVTTDEDGNLVRSPNTDGDDYTEVLPSLNVSLELTDEQRIRFGAARTLARARMDQMNASVSYNYDSSLANSNDLDNSPWSGGGGNPSLEPWLAKQYDLSYEFYFSDTGYVSVAGFYKDLENYTFEESVVYDFSDITVPDPQPILSEGYVTAPANGEGGEIHGIEMTVSVTGDLIADALSGFGLTVSGSITDSDVSETSDSDSIDLPGLSKKVLNTTFYYENSGFEARVSSRYRSSFLGEVTGLSLTRQMHYVEKELVVDAQVGYNFSESGYENLEGLSVMFQVTNLTDEPFTTYSNGDQRQTRDYQVYGRNYMLGMNYTF